MICAVAAAITLLRLTVLLSRLPSVHSHEKPLPQFINPGVASKALIRVAKPSTDFKVMRIYV